jgi:hypothetical protein
MDSNLAMPEKALLDCIYYHNAATFEDELESEGLDTGRLQEMAQSFPVRVREIVGMLAEKRGALSKNYGRGGVKSYETKIVGKGAVFCGFLGDHAATG